MGTTAPYNLISLRLAHAQWQPIAEGLLADEYDWLVCAQAADNLEIDTVVEAGLNSGPLCLAIGHREDKRPGLLRDQGFDWGQEGVRFRLDRDSDGGIHAGAKLGLLVWDFDLSQHRLRRLIQRVSIAGDTSVERASREFLHRDFDGQAVANERYLRLRHRHLHTHFRKVHQGQQSGVLRGAAGRGRRDERAGVNHTTGDHAGKWGNDS